jgi:hypothetical protein
MEGKQHIGTVPVKLSRACNNLRKQHVDSHFALATIRQLLDSAVLLREKTTFVLSQDDKARVPLGLAAANKQSPILMHVHYRISSSVYMARLGQYEFVLFVPPLKTLKNEVFVSFNMEFKLKYYRKSSKTIMFRYCGVGTVRIVRARKITDFYQIKRKNSQK